MDEFDVWQVEPRAGEIGVELAAGAAGLLVIGAAMMLLLQIVLGWHLAG